MSFAPERARCASAHGVSRCLPRARTSARSASVGSSEAACAPLSFPIRISESFLTRPLLTGPTELAEIEEDAPIWYEYDARFLGDPDTPKNLRKHPQGFTYPCCGKRATWKGCATGRHRAAYDGHGEPPPYASSDDDEGEPDEVIEISDDNDDEVKGKTAAAVPGSAGPASVTGPTGATVPAAVPVPTGPTGVTVPPEGAVVAPVDQAAVPVPDAVPAAV
ncbi:hypothetical protein B0T24DRAFT_615579 [Lasiosphaeria ovina]|uniref:Uncharacterized protein n=1 Tax=Lasiosphaeria ovina TaxID=92902 RepID=A0AAE0TUU7_9PEZI|nr:hypothetical protein B0T24DRAFT_615579 [Lasiosphaeria ovina]